MCASSAKSRNKLGFFETRLVSLITKIFTQEIAPLRGGLISLVEA